MLKEYPWVGRAFQHKNGSCDYIAGPPDADGFVTVHWWSRYKDRNGERTFCTKDDYTIESIEERFANGTWVINDA